MVSAHGEWENNALVNISKIVTWGEKLVNCWVCHKNPGLQQLLQVQTGTYHKSYTTDSQISKTNLWLPKGKCRGEG